MVGQFGKSGTHSKVVKMNSAKQLSIAAVAAFAGTSLGLAARIVKRCDVGCGERYKEAWHSERSK